MNLKIRPMLAASGCLLATASLALARSQLSYPAAGTAPSVDAGVVAQAISAAKAGDAARARAYIANLSDPAARKLVLWELLDAAPETLNFVEADGALRDLTGWPHESLRIAAAENQLATAGLAPSAVVAWFAGRSPATAQGALALAGALNASGRTGPATDLIRAAWRTMACDQDTQDAMLARFGDVLTPGDHVAREDMLLYGPQGPATQDMIRLLPADQRALALARIAVRGGDPNAQSLIDALPPALRTSPGLTYERVLSLRDHGQPDAALALVDHLPDTLPPEAAERLWRHGNLAETALRAGDYRHAYQAAAHSGLTSGADAAEAEFEAGWLALTRLKDARLADVHFARLQALGMAPLTQSRALYWRGRAAEAMGDLVAAQRFYNQAARYQTAFYGQLAGAKVGLTTIDLGHDPAVTAADLTQFEARDYIRAARLIFENGSKETYYAFISGLSETLSSAADEAMLIDFTRGLGDQSLSMTVVRNAAKRGFILPERGYPIHAPPPSYGAAETAFVLGITRQESSFDPRAHSGVGARGMMQLMPSTARLIARRIGAGAGDLDDPDYNMRLGAAYLGQLVDRFGGSYVMAAAAYDAGPGRPPQWVAACGDPRSASADPLEFIECIPFGETRDYVMRVLEATQVYRARLNGGKATNMLASDLGRGAYGYASIGAVADIVR